MKRIGEELREIILRSLVGKTGVEARTTIASLSESIGLSEGHIYRITKSLRPTRRAPRRDVGKRRLVITEDQIDRIQKLTVKYNISADRAIEIAALNGIIPSGELIAGSYNRILRERAVTRRRLKRDSEPSALFEAAYANQIHHFDASKLEHLHYDAENDLITFDPRRNYKNSRGERAAPVWLYLIVDDFSRAEFAALYLDLNHYNHLDFVYRAWAQKAVSSEFPFYGIPRHIYMDKGGGNQSLKFLSALATLGVHVIPTTPSTQDPHGARKHGKVESAFKFYNAWEQEFQLCRPLSWKESEAWLYERLLWRNRREHSATRQAPFQRWLNIERPHHVPGEEFYRTLCYDRWTREVSNFLTISLDGETYKLPEQRPCVNWVGEKVQVYAERGARENLIAVRDGKEVIAKKVTRDNLVHPAFHYPRGGETTSIEEARAKATGTYGPMKLWEGDPPPSDKGTVPLYLPRRGQDFDNSKIKLDGPPSFDMPAMPATQDDRLANREIRLWRNRSETIMSLIELGIFEPGKRSDEELAFIDLLMNGRERIEYDEIVAAAKRWKKAEGNDG